VQTKRTLFTIKVGELPASQRKIKPNQVNARRAAPRVCKLILELEGEHTGCRFAWRQAMRLPYNRDN
jgi:hypothetical protein